MRLILLYIQSLNLLFESKIFFTLPGTPTPQLSSCFLLPISGDSIEGIYDTLKETALISKYGGGVGLAISNVRATGSRIVRTSGKSRGLVPMVKVFAATSSYVDQGGSKRPGAFALYLEPWHADLYEFLELRKNQGNEDMRARKIFTALWVPDLFMKRVEKNEDWTFMCPMTCPGLQEAHNEEFEKLYTK